MSRHNHVWAQSSLGTVMWAQSCIIATYPTKFTSLSWYEMSIYYALYILQSHFFQIKNISLKRARPEFISGYTILKKFKVKSLKSVKVQRQIQTENWHTMSIMCLAT